MKKMWFAPLLLLSSLFFAQDNNSSNMSQQSSKDSNGQVTVQGCVSRSSGDYILMKQDPAVSYELQATDKTKLSHYLGQQVEVTGKESPAMSTSSDSAARAGTPSSVTLTVTSIKTIAKECSSH
jgi:hypothetical protein